MHICSINLEVGADSGVNGALLHKGSQETEMSKSIKLMSVLGFVAIVAACGNNREEEFVVVDPEPISVEPTYTGKFK